MKTIRSKINHFPLLTVASGGAFCDGIAAARTGNDCHHTKHLLQERVVYSLLAYRSRKGLGATVRDIARTTSLHHLTVKTTLNNLADLVHEYEGKWHANEPPEGWFRASSNHTVEHWSERYAYTWTLLPRQGAKFESNVQPRRFSLNHAIVYSYLLSLAATDGSVPGFTVAGLSTMLHGLNPKTIKTILGDLAMLRLIEQENKSVKLLEFKESHLNLFAPPKKWIVTKDQTIKPVSRPKTNKYQMKGDGFDEHRHLCQSFMSQSYAERVIRAIRFLGMSLTDFHLHLEDRKKDSEDNVKSGKCAVENFGKFYVTPLEDRVAAILKERNIAEAMQRKREFQNGQEGKELAAKQLADAAANPLHPQHIVDEDSIRQRVKLASDPSANWFEAKRLKSKVYDHCRTYVKSLALGHQREIDKTGDLVAKTLKLALAKVNNYFGQQDLAPVERFQTAIDEAISEINPAMSLMFAKTACCA